MEPAIARALTRKGAPARGFTLVEMVVVLAIISIITLIAVFGQTTFNRSMVLTDTAYTLAFSIREAQSFGLSSRVFNATQNAGYGLHFVHNIPTSYTLFADTLPGASGNTQDAAQCPGHTTGTVPEAKPGDCRWSSAAETVRTYGFNKGFYIKSFCGKLASSPTTERCNGSQMDSLTIVYMRPNTQSIINGIQGTARTPLLDATIRIASPGGASERCVYVSKMGQVSVLQQGETLCP